MQLLMSKPLCFVLLCLSFQAAGCGPNHAGLSGAEDEAAISGLFSEYTKAFDSPNYLANIHSLKGSDWLDEYKQSASELTDAPVQIGNYVYADSLKITKAMKSTYEDSHSKFSSVGAYWHSIGLDPQKSVTLAEYKMGLKAYDDFVKHWAEKRSYSSTPEELMAIEKMHLVNLALSLSPKKNALGFNLAPLEHVYVPSRRQLAQTQNNCGGVRTWWSYFNQITYNCGGQNNSGSSADGRAQASENGEVTATATGNLGGVQVNAQNAGSNNKVTGINGKGAGSGNKVTGVNAAGAGSGNTGVNAAGAGSGNTGASVTGNGNGNGSGNGSGSGSPIDGLTQ